MVILTTGDIYFFKQNLDPKQTESFLKSFPSVKGIKQWHCFFWFEEVVELAKNHYIFVQNYFLLDPTRGPKGFSIGNDDKNLHIPEITAKQ